MRLFVGLGNPGAKHAHNRHNIGFMIVDEIARRHGFAPWRRRFQGETAEGTLDRERVVLLKPLTFMNESGRAVKDALEYSGLGLAELLVFHDEIELAGGQRGIGYDPNRADVVARAKDIEDRAAGNGEAPVS